MQTNKKNELSEAAEAVGARGETARARPPESTAPNRVSAASLNEGAHSSERLAFGQVSKLWAACESVCDEPELQRRLSTTWQTATKVPDGIFLTKNEGELLWGVETIEVKRVCHFSRDISDTTFEKQLKNSLEKVTTDLLAMYPVRAHHIALVFPSDATSSRTNVRMAEIYGRAALLLAPLAPAVPGQSGFVHPLAGVPVLLHVFDAPREMFADLAEGRERGRGRARARACLVGGGQTKGAGKQGRRPTMG